ncbi:MAG TPA: TolC family protein, partial [Spirochaetota bacterium]|nr:TolC family protein [Spirochaetota bacterium]
MANCKKLTIQILILTVLPLLLSARLQADRVINLKKALHLAKKNNVTLKKQQNEIQIARHNLQSALYSLWVPNASISFDTSFLDQDTINDAKIGTNMIITNIPVVDAGYTPTGNYVPLPISDPDAKNIATVQNPALSARLSINKPLFAGFALKTAVENARYKLKTARRILKEKTTAVTCKVMRDFYNLFLLQQQIDLTSDMLNNLRERTATMKANYDAGRISEYEYTSVKVQYLNMAPEIIKLSNTLLTAKRSFINYLGIDNKKPVKFEGEISQIKKLQIPDYTKKQFTEKALLHNSSIETLRDTLKNIARQKKSLRSARLPTVSGYFNFQYQYAFDEKEMAADNNRTWQPSWNLGLQLNLPLSKAVPFSSAQKKEQNAALQEKNASIQLTDLKRNIELQVTSLLQKIKETGEILKS